MLTRPCPLQLPQHVIRTVDSKGEPNDGSEFLQRWVRVHDASRR